MVVAVWAALEKLDSLTLEDCDYMRLDSIADSLYTLGALWSAITGSSVCPSAPYGSSKIAEAAGQSRIPVTAFVDVNVVPMDTERVLLHQTVIVRDDQIIALGPTNQIDVPAGAVRVDGQGKYLMPGLADMHYGGGHWLRPPSAGEEEAVADQLFTRYSAQGITALRSVTGSPLSDVQKLQRLAADFPVPRMYLASPWVPRLPSLQADSVAAYVAQMKADGYSLIDADDAFANFSRQFTGDSATMAALRKGGLPVATHLHWLSFEQALKLGVGGGSVEHIYAFWDSLLGKPGPIGTDLSEKPQPVDLPVSKIPGLVAAVKRADLWVTPSLECMTKVHPYIRGNGLAQIVKAMQAADVKMLLGGDTWGLSPASVHSELVAMVKAGLTPYQALLTGTRNVAEYLHELDRAGTVAVGKQADLVLLNGNPLQDVRQTWEPAGVMLAGRWFGRAALDRRLVASPRRWLKELLGLYLPADPLDLPLPKEQLRALAAAVLSVPRSAEQWNELEQRSKRIYALADSLGPTTSLAYAQTVELITVEFGSIRAVLAPEQREAFDVHVRVWTREQARQAQRLMNPGVTPVP